MLAALSAKTFWPPQLGESYPDLILMDSHGQKIRLSDLTGKVIIIEYVGMTCPACQAFSGAHIYGAYQNIEPQQGLASFKEYFTEYTKGISLKDDRIVFIQMILYSMTMGVPSLEDVHHWAKHFHLDQHSNFLVLMGTKEMLGEDSYNLIPGFQLIDKNFILRYDSTGHHPRHNLFTELLPMVPKILEESYQ